MACSLSARALIRLGGVAALRAGLVAGLVAGAGALPAGCADQGLAAMLPDPDGGFVLPPVTYVANIGPLIKKYGCFGCHMTDTYDGVETLTNAKDIVAYYTSHSPEECASTTYIAPGDPDGSYIYQKVTGQGSCFTGKPMPYGSGPLPSNVSEVVRDWIMHGAVVE